MCGSVGGPASLWVRASQPVPTSASVPSAPGWSRMRRTTGRDRAQPCRRARSVRSVGQVPRAEGWAVRRVGRMLQRAPMWWRAQILRWAQSVQRVWPAPHRATREQLPREVWAAARQATELRRARPEPAENVRATMVPGAAEGRCEPWLHDRIRRRTWHPWAVPRHKTSTSRKTPPSVRTDYCHYIRRDFEERSVHGCAATG